MTIRLSVSWSTALLVLVMAVLPSRPWAQGAEMFSTTGVSDKPQSKLWHHNGSWYAALNNATNLAIYKLSGTTWQHKLDIQNAAIPTLQGGTCDVLWDGTHLFVAVYGTASSKIYKLSYDAPADSFAILAGFPVSLTMPTGSETIVIDKDSTGRLWATYESGQKVYVTYTTSADHQSWGTPYALSGTVETDDISTIVAFGGDKIGVIWSDQRTHQVCFRVHSDSQAPTSWQPTEVVRSGFGVVDDHLNLKADSQGRVYVVAKDWFDAVYVARRDIDGTWNVTTGASGLDCGTRPILQIDEASNKLHVFYTRWAQCVSTGNHSIEERVAFLDNLLFSLPTVVITRTGVQMNEVQGTKQLLPDSSVAVLCQGSDGKAYWTGWGPTSGIGGIDPGGAFPPPPAPPADLQASEVTESASTRLLLWRLDETSGATATDASGSGRNGTLGTGVYAPHRVTALIDNGLFFDGDDYVSANGSGLAFTGSSFTLETWFKVDLTNSAGTGMLFSKGDQLHANYQFSLKGEEFELGWSLDDTTDVTVKTTQPVRDGAWHHVAAVYDASSMTGRIFVDGKKEVEKTMLPPTYGDSWKVYVGALVDGPFVDKTFSGYLDLVSIAGSALYSSSFTPPLLYPSSSASYVRVSWSSASSVAGIAGYAIRRNVNGGGATVLNAALTPNSWFPDFVPPDGFLNYGVRAVDGLTQQGVDGWVVIGYESNPPAVPAAPQNLSYELSTATVEGPAFWELNEGTGATTADGTDLGHTARLGDPGFGDTKEPSWVIGFNGPALRFDGNNDYIEVEDAPDLRLTGSFTVETWVRRLATGTAHALLSKDEGSSKRNYLILLRSDNKIEFSWSKTSGSTQKATSSATITDQNWHHIACVYDASQSRNLIYLDGVEVGSGSVSGTVYTGSQPVRLGARGSSSGGGSLSDPMKGDLDLVRISDFIRYTGPFTPPGTYLGSGRRYVVQVSWSLPPSGFVNEYKLYRKLLPIGSSTLVATLPYPFETYLDGSVTQNNYEYTVRATNSDNVAGPASAPLVVTIPEPTDAVETGPPLPRGTRLRVSPNPFNPSTTVTFRIETPGLVDVRVYDARGRLVDTLVHGKLPAGVHRIPLVRTDRGERLASGVYFVRLHAEGRDTTVRAVLVQ